MRIGSNFYKLSKCYTIYLSFETVKPPKGVDTFVECFDKSPAEIAIAVSSRISSSISASKRRTDVTWCWSNISDLFLQASWYSSTH